MNRWRCGGQWAAMMALMSGVWAVATSARAEDVGLGLALGGSYSPTALKAGSLRREAGAGMAGGFFVDIPLSSWLRLSPSATLWALDLGQGREPATDFDLAGKLMVPVGPLRVGGGLGLGLSHLERHLWPHLAAQALVAVELTAGLEAFAQLTYKHVVRSPDNVEAAQGMAGLLWQL